ncbi:unnamed protein product [Allacma fusca]|uniref:Uncharacterized protein n=1 Tax=Allacma fusca TaxID=39272 RepID=A0A8J2P1E2_9HEXA|nr:unnamed protein product [Allacma fusca]
MKSSLPQRKMALSQRRTYFHPKPENFSQIGGPCDSKMSCVPKSECQNRANGLHGVCVCKMGAKLSLQYSLSLRHINRTVLGA